MNLWRSLRISAFEHPNVKEGREVIPGGVTKEFIERIEKEYGKGSSVYQSRVLGEFPEDADEGVFSRAWLEAAALRHETGELRLASMDAPPIVSVDPARFGPDKTVVAIRHGQLLNEFVSWSKQSTMETVGLLRELLPKVGIVPRQDVPILRPAYWGGGRVWSKETRGGDGIVIVDVVGVGGGVVDRLREVGYPVVAFNGGESPRVSSKYLNRRAESFWNLRGALEGGKIAIPRDEELFEELLAIRWKPTSSGLIQIEAKDDLRGRLGRSPDKADSAAMCFWAQVRVSPDHRPLRRTWA